MPTPGSVRPRGRTERVRKAVLAATVAHLVESGPAGLTVERVAESAGVAKSTVYRRWRDTAGLLLEVLYDLSEAEIPLAETGSLDEELQILAEGIVRLYANSSSAAMVLALIAEGIRNERVAAGLRQFWHDRNIKAAAAVRRGIERGELPPDTDPVEVIRLLGAPIYYRLLVTHEPLDDAVAHRAAAATLAAARAGMLRTAEEASETARPTDGDRP